jgi:hypothetical protein
MATSITMSALDDPPRRLPDWLARARLMFGSIDRPVMRTAGATPAMTAQPAARTSPTAP